MSFDLVCFNFVHPFQAYFVDLRDTVLTFITVILVNGWTVYSAIQNVKCYHLLRKTLNIGTISSVTFLYKNLSFFLFSHTLRIKGVGGLRATPALAERRGTRYLSLHLGVL